MMRHDFQSIHAQFGIRMLTTGRYVIDLSVIPLTKTQLLTILLLRECPNQSRWGRSRSLLDSAAQKDDVGQEYGDGDTLEIREY